ncbi:hypothetical protein BC829DRAFT_491703 [Chytridium lagenaria]|nr:hypothetical protein BC829DRAFT_491703 [Chytridium lagenaria]
MLNSIRKSLGFRNFPLQELESDEENSRESGVEHNVENSQGQFSDEPEQDSNVYDDAPSPFKKVSQIPQPEFRKRIPNRKHAASTRKQATSPYARPVITSTPMPLRKARADISGTPASSRELSDKAEQCWGEDVEGMQEEAMGEEEEVEEEVNELEDDEDDVRPVRKLATPYLKKAGKAPVEVDDDVILIDDDLPSKPAPRPLMTQNSPDAPLAAAALSDFSSLASNKSAFSGQSGPSAGKELPLHWPSSFESSSSNSNLTAPSPFTAFMSGSQLPSSTDTDLARNQSGLSRNASSAITTARKDFFLLGATPQQPQQSSGGLFSINSKDSGAAAPTSGAGSKERAVSPTRKAFVELTEFLSRRGGKPLSADETQEIQRLLSQSTGTNVTLQTPVTNANKSFAMSVSDLNPPTRTFSQPLFQPSQSTSQQLSRQVGSHQSLFNSSSASNNVFSAGSVSSIAVASRPSTSSSTITAAKARARRRQFQYFGASLGYNQNPYRKRPALAADQAPSSSFASGSIFGAGRSDVIVQPPQKRTESSAKRPRMQDQSNDQAAQLILNTLDDLAPPPTSLLPTYTDKASPINPYEKDVFAPTVVHQIPKPPVLPKVNSIIREVKTAIAPPESKSALLKAKISEKPKSGTPARPPERNVGVLNTSTKASPAPTFPLVSSQASAGPSSFPMISSEALSVTKSPKVTPVTVPSNSSFPTQKPSPISAFSFASSNNVNPSAKAEKEATPVAAIPLPKPSFSFTSLTPKPTDEETKPTVAPTIPTFQFSAPVKLEPLVSQSKGTEFNFVEIPISPLSQALKAFEREIDSKPLPNFDFNKTASAITPERSPLSESSRSKLLETTKSVTAAFSPEKPFTFVPTASKSDSVQMHWGAPPAASNSFKIPGTSAPGQSSTPASVPAFSFSFAKAGGDDAKGTGSPTPPPPTPIAAPTTSPFSLPPSATPLGGFGTAKPEKSVVPGFTPVYTFGLSTTNKVEPPKDDVASAAAAADAAPTVPAKFNWGRRVEPSDDATCIACGTKKAEESSAPSLLKPTAFSFGIATPKTTSPKTETESSEEVKSEIAASKFNWGSAGVPKPAAPCTSALRPVDLTGGAAGKAAPVNTGWNCSTCFTRNKETDCNCASCQAPKPGVSSSAPATASSGFSMPVPPSSASGFSFGGTPTSAASGFSFGDASTSNPFGNLPTTGGFSFGKVAAEKKDAPDAAVETAAPLNPFSFGGVKPATGIAFKVTENNDNDTGKTDIKAAAPAFSFRGNAGAAATSSFGSLNGSAATTPSFGFGLNAGQNNTAPTFGFKFGGTADAASLNPQAAPFTPQGSSSSSSSSGFSFAGMNAPQVSTASGLTTGFGVQSSSPFGGSGAPQFGFGAAAGPTGELKKEDSAKPSVGFQFGLGPKAEDAEQK